MPLDGFLKFEGPEIKGDSLVEGHIGELQLLSYSWGLSNTGSTHEGPGSGTGKLHAQDLSCIMTMDRSISNLLKYGANGKHIEKVTLFSRRAGGDEAVTFLKHEMENVLISSVQFGASDGGEAASVSFALNFGKYKFTYTPQTESGTGDPEVVAGWDIARNKDNS